MRGSSRIRLAVGLVALIAALSMAAIAVPVALASKGEDFHGKVASTHSHPRTVKVDTGSRGTMQFRVTQRTRFEHIHGFSGLKPGLRVEVQARHRNGGWVATKIERHQDDRPSQLAP
jgi:hypothetical protein